MVHKPTDETKKKALQAAKMLKKMKNPGTVATERHMEWLKNLKIMKAEAKQKKEELKKKNEAKISQFVERSNLLRTLIREGKWKEEFVDKKKGAAAKKKTQKKLEVALKTSNSKLKEMLEEVQPEKVPDQKTELPKDIDKRPTWSLTKEQLEKKAKAEEDDLLNFALNLDYEKFMDDMDVRDAIEFVQKRVQDLEEEKDDIEKEEKDVEGEVKEIERAEKAAERAIEKAATGAQDNKSVQSRAKNTTKLDDSGSSEEQVAETAMKLSDADIVMKNKAIMKVHSKASISKVIEKEMQNLSTRPILTLAQRWEDESGNGSSASQKNSTRVKHERPILKPSTADQKRVQNLPYLYRHPAI